MTQFGTRLQPLLLNRLRALHERSSFISLGQIFAGGGDEPEECEALDAPFYDQRALCERFSFTLSTANTRIQTTDSPSLQCCHNASPPGTARYHLPFNIISLPIRGTACHCDGGYPNFITDTRSDTYFKMYIGQSKVLLDRIGQHRSAIAMGDMTSLHYFIVATGQLFRKENFVRLFCLKPEIFQEEEYADLCRNLLEFLMTLAFQTLPRPVLTSWLPEALIRAPPKTLHLNVLSPLYQRAELSANLHVRQANRDFLRASPDPQLSRWPVFRTMQFAEQEKQRLANHLRHRG